ncbi:hypothetical protein M885DRAFT_529181 [Pelagophyceae sp. CCMP2097]|nr:hypothetical protein M885DRAFT_529181 [Pelagophyceae sp. CCMP2097]
MAEAMASVILTRDGSGATEWRWADEAPPPAPRHVGKFATVAPAAAGLGLFARRNVAAGDVLLRAAPVAHVIFDTALPLCALCGGDVCSAGRCGACARAFCGEACAAAGAEDHAAECASAEWPHAPPACRLAARVLRRCRRDAAVRSYVDDLDVGGCAPDGGDSEDGDGALDAAAVVVARLVGADAAAAPAEASTASSGAPRIRRLLRGLQRNVHTVYDDELRPIGVGLLPRAATAANHACDPNIWQRFEIASGRAPRLAYVSLAAVAAGAELCHAYDDVTNLPRSERRSHLAEKYGFDCVCAACAAGDGESLRGSDVRVQSEAIEAAIRGRDFASAAAYSVAAAPKYAAAYPQAHPQRGLHDLRTAKLLLAVNDPEAAAKHAKLAIESIKLSHGEDSQLFRTSEKLLSEALRSDDGSDDD